MAHQLNCVRILWVSDGKKAFTILVPACLKVLSSLGLFNFWDNDDFAILTIHMWVGVGVGLTYISDILAGEIVIVIVGHVGPRPRIFLAILPDSKQVQFFQFGIGIVFLTSESKKRIELLKVILCDSMRVSSTVFLESESFSWFASPKIQNWICLELHRIISSCLGLPTKKSKKIRGLVGPSR